MKARLPRSYTSGVNNIQQLARQAQKLQEDMDELAKELEEKEYSATSGGGAVTVTVTGKSHEKADGDHRDELTYEKKGDSRNDIQCKHDLEKGDAVIFAKQDEKDGYTNTCTIEIKGVQIPGLGNGKAEFLCYLVENVIEYG